MHHPGAPCHPRIDADTGTDGRLAGWPGEALATDLEEVYTVPNISGFTSRVGANRPRSFLLPESWRCRHQLRNRPPLARDWGGKARGDTKLSTQRYISQTGLEARIAAIIEPVTNDLGFDLVRVKILPDHGMTVQIMAEDRNGQFSIADCERLSREINPLLDVEDPIEREYHLEVSSPGIDRPLVRVRDFERFVGHEARVELRNGIDGRRRYRGEIAAVTDETVTIRLPDVPEGLPAEHELPLSDVAEAKLIMTDALLEAARRDQQNNNPLDNPEIEAVEDNEEELN